MFVVFAFFVAFGWLGGLESVGEFAEGGRLVAGGFFCGGVIGAAYAECDEDEADCKEKHCYLFAGYGGRGWFVAGVFAHFAAFPWLVARAHGAEYRMFVLTCFPDLAYSEPGRFLFFMLPRGCVVVNEEMR